MALSGLYLDLSCIELSITVLKFRVRVFSNGSEICRGMMHFVTNLSFEDRKKLMGNLGKTYDETYEITSRTAI